MQRRKHNKYEVMTSSLPKVIRSTALFNKILPVEDDLFPGLDPGVAYAGTQPGLEGGYGGLVQVGEGLVEGVNDLRCGHSAHHAQHGARGKSKRASKQAAVVGTAG